MSKKLEECSVVELKAIWFDLLVESENVQKKIQMVRAELEKKQKEQDSAVQE